jgi:type I restriction enzyme S subunit
LGDDLDKYLVVEPGDIVFNKLRTWQGGLGVSKYKGIVSPAYFVCRPIAGVEPRYLHYLLRSAPYLQELTRISKWMPPSQFDIGWEQLRLLPILRPNIGTQRAVADYLDAETARLDALIEKKRRLIELLKERFGSLLEGVVSRNNQQQAPLMHLTDPWRPIMYGIVLPGPNVDEGVPIVKGGDVASRRLRPESLNRTTVEIEAPYARARLVPGDLVFAIRGGIGDVEEVPPEIAGANITQDVARVAPRWGVDPRWLRLVLRSSSSQNQVAARVTGATVKGLNIWDLKRIKVPIRTHDQQRDDLEELNPAEQKMNQLIAVLGFQLSRFF